jgi:NAD(P)-dependent dehydrogenase (short-subunit alcohol dehydrogenase family)
MSQKGGDMGRLEGKTVVITGAGSGQGQCGAVLFAEEGANLALCDINEAGLAETVRLVSKLDAKVEVLTHQVDLTVSSQLSAFVKAVIDKFEVIDVIYNNAGVINLCPMEQLTEEIWDKIHAINSKAAYFLVKEALPALKRSTSGSVINVSSGAGLSAPYPGMSAYCSSKGALIAATRSMAQDLAAYGVRVNCIVPGVIDTPMSQGFYRDVPAEEREQAKADGVARSLQKRAGRPEEVAAVAVFLATSDASYINAATIPVDDGYLAI